MSVSLVIDIFICIVFAIAVAVGLVKGFGKQVTSPLIALTAILGAIALAGIIYPTIYGTGILNGFTSTASGWFKGDALTTVVTNGDELRTAMSGSVWSVLGGVSDKLFYRIEHSLTNTAFDFTLGNYLGKLIVDIICEFVLWLLLFFAIRYLLIGIKYLLKQMTRYGFFKVIDRFVGMVWAIGLTYVIVVGVILTASELIVVRFAPGAQHVLSETIEQSVVLKFFHNTNILGNILSNLFGMPLVAT